MKTILTLELYLEINKKQFKIITDTTTTLYDYFIKDLESGLPTASTWKEILDKHIDSLHSSGSVVRSI